MALPRPSHRLGWLLSAVGALTGLGLLTDTRYGTISDPSPLETVVASVHIEEWMWLAGPWLLFTVVLQRFPPGSCRAALGVLEIAVAMTVAILHHRLFDIDKLVSRTVSYAGVTGALALVYAATTTTMAALLPMGMDQPLVVAGATLVAAGLFRPLRSRVQAAVDGRFDRARYDARRTVDAYRARLRDAVELDAVSADLLAAVHPTVAPAQASVWLRPSVPRSGGWGRRRGRSAAAARRLQPDAQRRR